VGKAARLRRVPTHRPMAELRRLDPRHRSRRIDHVGTARKVRAHSPVEDGA